MKLLLSRNEDTEIWIVEDNPGDLMLLQEQLVELNFKAKHIRSFSDLESFQEAISTHCPDIVLLDLFLPGSQGSETYARIKSSTECCPVIVLSGLDSMDTAFECVKLGAQDYLIKDELNEEIINKILNYAIERFANIQELKRSEEKYRVLFKSIPLAVVMLDENHRILEMNDTAKSLLKVESNADMAEYKDLFTDPAVKETAHEGIITDKVKLLKLNLEDEKVSYIEQASVRNSTGFGKRFLVTLTDRTAIIESELNKNRIVHETLDDERNRFSRELHDGLAQYLVVLNLQLEMLKGLDERVDSGLAPCQDAVSTSLKMVRSISYNLSPPDIEKGIIPALQALFQRLQNVNNVRFILRADETLEDLDLSFVDEYSVFRIVQEFINNSLKYSECKEILCEIGLSGKLLNITVSDNGKGFDMVAVPKGLGLKNMRQRAFAADFNIELSSEVNKGTTLNLTSSFPVAD